MPGKELDRSSYSVKLHPSRLGPGTGKPGMHRSVTVTSVQNDSKGTVRAEASQRQLLQSKI